MIRRNRPRSFVLVLTAALAVGLVAPAAVGADTPEPPFPDVPSGAFYAEAVTWMAQEGITDGIGNTGMYMPGVEVNRGQMAAFLWRLEGRPAPGTPHDFPDVNPGAYFEDAVSWLLEEGITDGLGTTGNYAPAVVVNRAQMVTFLWRLAGRPAPAGDDSFPDVPEGSYYETAVEWAVEEGITDGVGDTGLFVPLDPVDRGQMAAFIWRYAGEPAPNGNGNGA